MVTVEFKVIVRGMPRKQYLKRVMEKYNFQILEMPLNGTPMQKMQDMLLMELLRQVRLFILILGMWDL